MATFPEAAEAASVPGGTTSGYFGTGLDPFGDAPIVRHAILLEAFLTAPEGQLDHFERSADGAVLPVLRTDRRTPEDHEALAQLHAGALAYAEDLIGWYGQAITGLRFSPAAAFDPVVALARGRITAPIGLLHALRVDDAFCGYDEHEVGLDLAAVGLSQPG